MTYREFRLITEQFPKWTKIIATKGTVFARMSPDDKTNLICKLDEVGHQVLMCGDGANDCGALKRAHVGISLSEYEASVAAPFTSSTHMGVECVPLLMREGRAALVTSYSMFKYMATYSMTQFTSVVILFSHFAAFSNWAYLYIDLLVIDLVVITMSRNYPCKKLSKSSPPDSLVSIEILTSLIFNCLFQLIVQICADKFLTTQCWFNDINIAQVNESVFYNASSCPSDYDLQFVDQTYKSDDEDEMTYHASNLLFLSSFMYLSSATAYSTSRPFRTRFYKNKLFFAAQLLLLASTLILLFRPPFFLLDWIEFRPIPDWRYKVDVCAFALLYFVTISIFEVKVVENARFWKFLKKRNHKKKYESVLSGLERNEENLNPRHLIGRNVYGDV